MEPMGRPSKDSPELRERAVPLVLEHASEYPSQWATMRSVAGKLGLRTDLLRRRVRQAERNGGQLPGLTTGERGRVCELISELRLASHLACSSPGGLDSRPPTAVKPS